MYDVCRPETFKSLSRWIEESELHFSGDSQPVVRYIVANKIDEKELRVVSTETALDFIESVQTSKNSENEGSDLSSKPPHPYHKDFKPAPSDHDNFDTPPPHIDGYYEVSAKNTDGVRNMFVSMVEQIIASGVLDPPQKSSGSRLVNYSSWRIPSFVDLSRPFTETVGNCYPSC